MARITFHVVKLSRENRKMDFILKILTGKIFVRSGGGVFAPQKKDTAAVHRCCQTWVDTETRK